MYCATCGYQLGEFVPSCPNCGLNLSTGGSIRFTDPKSELALEVKKRDLSRQIYSPPSWDKPYLGTVSVNKPAKTENDSTLEDKKQPVDKRNLQESLGKYYRPFIFLAVLIVVLAVVVGLAFFLLQGMKVTPPNVSPTSIPSQIQPSPAATPGG